MAKFHFVEDYEKYVDHLMSLYSIDVAMEMAVGGNFEHTGSVELEVLRHVGLKSGMAIFDLGCGSGRLSHALGKSGIDLDYIGTDVVQALLDYAATRSPSGYRYVLHRGLSVPAENNSIDIACAFSVFTHLLHYETFLYLEDMKRALKPGGRIVFSFLEFAEPGHWHVFKSTVDAQRTEQVGHLNMFIERNAIELWAKQLGLSVVGFVDAGKAAIEGGSPLGQTTAILQG